MTANLVKRMFETVDFVTLPLSESKTLFFLTKFLANMFEPIGDDEETWFEQYRLIRVSVFEQTNRFLRFIFHNHTKHIERRFDEHDADIVSRLVKWEIQTMIEMENDDYFQVIVAGMVCTTSEWKPEIQERRKKRLVLLREEGWDDAFELRVVGIDADTPLTILESSPLVTLAEGQSFQLWFTIGSNTECLLNTKEAFWRLFDQNEKELLEERRRTIGKSDNTLAALPSLIFTKQTHFSTNCITLTRTDVGGDRDGDGRTSSVLIADTFSSGVISVSLTVLSLPLGKTCRGDICFGLMDAASAIPRIDEKLGTTIRSSVCVDSFGSVWTNTSTSHPSRLCLSRLNEDDLFRMEVDLDSNPRKVQFFKNGESGKCFVSHIPRSVKIGFSVTIQGTSFRVENVARLSQPTTLVDGMTELIW
ncbi:hypothetical protein BLNAU_14907 [Blattamonas nauphoetae]|uniref:SPRY domain-containing protein n=1 Tax=Blattamonas nauphoetae TaxID=2049346 RepID=A0ABQ9XFC0_9EUKA|nr:hypothetical protein BLNAU_14907 [Blattamonas nauphoetae]